MNCLNWAIAAVWKAYSETMAVVRFSDLLADMSGLSSLRYRQRLMIELIKIYIVRVC